MSRRIIGWLFIILILLAGSENYAEAKYFQQYNYGIKLELPDNWECVSQSSETFLAVFVAPEMQYSLNTLTLAHQPLPPRTLLADYVQQAVQKYNKILTNYQLCGQQLVYDNPYAPYYLLTYTWDPATDTRVFVMQMITCRFPEVMIVTCCAPADMADHYEAVFLQIFNNLAFIN